ncbi:MAG: tRNA (guanosine(46)-N7)-methyltransferase TrmB [Gammaproteobacteria bacterium SHHR-1]|uniref:tRNA (guanosine(46)-N7)-methyltransferase TrmB n=1 Tax=Magnetovirga frankeli TaxID=947516 RepID=UPI0012930E42|nr:tRNA (guanosine(46)-N7)-methyltransferase TrmB [gamma proteobacterium SS-5]
MTDAEQSRPHAPIRSYVLRQGRMTRSQERAFAQFWPIYGLVPGPAEPLDPARLFAVEQPLFLEIGFGNGEGLAELARRHPERNYLGIEVHSPGVGHLLIRAAELQLNNLRLIRQDAVEVLRDHLPANCLDGIMLFFPDPWHKKRHHKRRIVQPAFLDLCARALKPGGILHLATDWQDYAEQMLHLLQACPQLSNCQAADGFAPRPEGRPLTRFEQRGQRLGHGVWDLLFRRL